MLLKNQPCTACSIKLCAKRCLTSLIKKNTSSQDQRKWIIKVKYKTGLIYLCRAIVNIVDDMKLSFFSKNCIFHLIHIDCKLFEIHTWFIWDNCGMDGDLNAHNSMQEAALNSVELAVDRTAAKFQYIYISKQCTSLPLDLPSIGFRSNQNEFFFSELKFPVEWLHANWSWYFFEFWM